MMRLTRNTITMPWTGTLHTGTAGFKLFTHKNSLSEFVDKQSTRQHCSHHPEQRDAGHLDSI